MHKLESFALSCGSKISKPFIESTFYPVLEKKYICMSTESDMQSKDYDFFDDVVFHIKPYLDKHEISVLDVGQSKKKSLYYSKSYKHLNRMQTNYVLSKSLLYCGNFNFHSHISNYYQKPVITVSNVDYIDVIKPYNCSDSFQVFTPASERKPSFASEESPKTINTVEPEKIACAILDALNIKHSLNNVSTIYTGEEYFNQIIDVVPGKYDIASSNLRGSVNIRLDKNFDLDFLAQCKTIEQINLVTDKIIPMDYLKFLGDNLKMISFFVNKDTTLLDIKNLQKSGKQLNLLCKDEKNLPEIRFNLIDYQVRLFGSKTKKDLNVKSFKNLSFLSKRNIIYNGQIFNSYLSLAKEKNTSSVSDVPEFWEDLPFCRVFKTSKKK
jgi:hypothetical protein